MTTIAVVQCGALKLPRAAPARELYVGPLFRALRRAAERLSTRWYVASAKHGLISPDRTILPYDATLPARGDPEWGARLLNELRRREPGGWDRLLALCSARYLAGWAEDAGAETPIKGMTIGRAISAARRIR